MLHSILPEAVRQAILAHRGEREVWLVGGAIRDQLLGRPVLDLDFAVSDQARALARAVADELRVPYYELDASRDTGRVVSEVDIDFAALRGGSIEEDLAARDFTVNSLAIPFSDPDRLIDLAGGLQDLKEGVLKATSQEAVRADPVRAVRAARLATEYGFSIEAASVTLLKQVGDGISRVSRERVRDELMLLLAQTDPSAGMRLLDHFQLLSALGFDVQTMKGIGHAQGDAWEVTLRIVSQLGRIMRVLGAPFRQDHAGGLTLGKLSGRLGRYRPSITEHLGRALAGKRSARESALLAALLLPDEIHPCNGYEDTREWSRFAYDAVMALALSKREARAVMRSIAWQGELSQLDPVLNRRHAYRLAHIGGDSAVEAVLLHLAIFLACHAPSPPQDRWDIELQGAGEILAFALAEGAQPLIRGDELAQSLGLTPGPILQQLLQAIREAQMVGELGDREDALGYAADYLGKLRGKSQ